MRGIGRVGSDGGSEWSEGRGGRCSGITVATSEPEQNLDQVIGVGEEGRGKGFPGLGSAVGCGRDPAIEDRLEGRCLQYT